LSISVPRKGVSPSKSHAHIRSGMYHWNELRETIFANRQRLGVIPQDPKMTPWPEDLLKR